VELVNKAEANYTGGMAAGGNPYKYALSALEQYGQENDFYRHLAREWNSKANPHV